VFINKQLALKNGYSVHQEKEEETKQNKNKANEFYY
jgi:hypothetical protein